MSRVLQQTIAVIIASTVLLGIAIHDTKLDTVAKVILALPAVLATLDANHSLVHAGEAHTHTERVSVDKVAGRFTVKASSLMARQFEDKRYRIGENKIRGHHPFDDALLPIPA